MEVKACRETWGNSVELLVTMKGSECVSVGKPIVFERSKAGQLTEPTMVLTNDAAQRLIDELWNCGLRPTEGTGSAGSLAATERHLKDMRGIALGLLHKDGVNHFL